jgi:hypothetical protein
MSVLSIPCGPKDNVCRSQAAQVERMSATWRGLSARRAEVMSQKFLHTKIIKAASDDFHAVALGFRLTRKR